MGGWVSQKQTTQTSKALELRVVCNVRVTLTGIKTIFFEPLRREKQTKKGSAPSLSQLARLFLRGEASSGETGVRTSVTEKEMLTGPGSLIDVHRAILYSHLTLRRVLM